MEWKIVDKKIKELISQFWIDIQERNHDFEIITLSHAQDGVEALMDRSLKLVTTLAAYQTINFQDEELTIIPLKGSMVTQHLLIMFPHLQQNLLHHQYQPHPL